VEQKQGVVFVFWGNRIHGLDHVDATKDAAGSAEISRCTHTQCSALKKACETRRAVGFVDVGKCAESLH